MPLIEEAHKAARILLDHAYVRIVARCEPDAVCAAALLAHALRRESVDFHVTWTPRLDAELAARLADERNDCLVLVGLSQDAEVDAPAATQRIAIESGACTLRAEAVVDGSAIETSLAALAHLVAAGLSKRNRDLAPLAIAGAIAASRHVGGMRGLDAEIVQEALDAGILLREPALALAGPTLHHALAQLEAPFVVGITGRARNVKKLVADLGLEGDSPPSAVQDPETLGSFLALRLLQQGAPDAALDALMRPSLRALQGPHTGLECGDLARATEAACAAGRCGLAFAALWPDPAAGGEVVEVQGAFREEIVAALLRAERDAKREGRMVVAEAPREGLCAPLADRLALSTAPAGHLAVAHAGSTLALRRFGDGPDALAAARRAAEAAGGRARGHAGAALVETADAQRALKALAEALG